MIPHRRRTVFLLPENAPPWLKLAHADLGTPELKNGELNPKVKAYFEHTNYPPQRVFKTTPWCSAAACAWFERAGFRSPRSASSLSWLSWGEPCDPLEIGALLIFSRPVAGTAPDRYGHNALSLGAASNASDADYMVLGGNQGNMVCLDFRPKVRLLGARLPVDYRL